MTLIKIEKEGLQRYLSNEINVGGLSLNFQRTCRVPSGSPLPAGLGAFPMFKVSDFKSGCPKHWNSDSVFFPMYRQEAMWINFNREYRNPKAVIVAAGNINAISGKPFDLSKNMIDKTRKKKSELKIELEEKQNYLVVPPQPWIDGWKGEGTEVYQFVAAELGSGETVEGQITGEESVGGIQLIVFGPKPGQDLIPKTRPNEYMTGGSWGKWSGQISSGYHDNISGMLGPQIKSCASLGDISYACCASSSNESSLLRLRGRRSSERYESINSIRDMGLGKGGTIEQKIYPDPYGFDVWNKTPEGSVRLYMVSSEDFKQITGYDAPPTPVTYKKYQELGLPWFELYDSKLKDTKGSGVFDKLKEVGEGKAKAGKDGKPAKSDGDWLVKFK
jgi:hypothetical protein